MELLLIKLTNEKLSTIRAYSRIGYFDFKTKALWKVQLFFF